MAVNEPIEGEIVNGESLPAVIEPQPEGGNIMLADPVNFAEALQRYTANRNALAEFVRTQMSEAAGDYYRVPGATKPALSKQGGENLVGGRLGLFPCEPEFSVVSRTVDYETPLFRFEFKCVLRMGGKGVGEGAGSCSSKESKYAARWLTKKKLPDGSDLEKLPKREREGKYGKYFEYLVENDAIQDIENTVLKMAKKRAYIDAALNATGASRYFTQDIEERHIGEALGFTPPPEEETKPPALRSDAMKKATASQAAQPEVSPPEEGIGPPEPETVGTYKAALYDFLAQFAAYGFSKEEQWAMLQAAYLFFDVKGNAFPLESSKHLTHQRARITLDTLEKAFPEMTDEAGSERAEHMTLAEALARIKAAKEVG